MCLENRRILKYVADSVIVGWLQGYKRSCGPGAKKTFFICPPLFKNVLLLLYVAVFSQPAISQMGSLGELGPAHVSSY